MHLMKQDIHCVALAGQELKVILLFYPWSALGLKVCTGLAFRNQNKRQRQVDLMSSRPP